jgi:hypothetical protein
LAFNPTLLVVNIWLPCTRFLKQRSAFSMQRNDFRMKWISWGNSRARFVRGGWKARCSAVRPRGGAAIGVNKCPYKVSTFARCTNDEGNSCFGLQDEVGSLWQYNPPLQLVADFYISAIECSSFR